MSNFFSWSPPMSRSRYLMHSMLPALLFALSLMAMQTILASTLPTFLGPLFALLALGIIIVAASANPLVIPMGGSLIAMLASCFPNMVLPRLSLATGISLSLLCFSVVLICILRLLALTVRRRRDAGAQAYPAFALPAVLYAGSMVLATRLLAYGESVARVLACLFLPMVVQAWMLLRAGSHHAHQD